MLELLLSAPAEFNKSPTCPGDNVLHFTHTSAFLCCTQLYTTLHNFTPLCSPATFRFHSLSKHMVWLLMEVFSESLQIVYSVYIYQSTNNHRPKPPLLWKEHLKNNELTFIYFELFLPFIFFNYHLLLHLCHT